MSEHHVPAQREAAVGDRYGPTRSPAARRRRRLLAAIVAATLGLGTLAWLGSGVLSVDVRTQDAGFAIVDDTAIDVTFIVAKAPDAVASCRVHALDPSFAEVGARDVILGADTHSSVKVTVRVATSQRATTGMVQACRLVDEP